MKNITPERIVTLLVGAIAAGVILTVGMRYIFPVFSPFIIAWLVAFAVRNPSHRLSERTRISERIIRPILAIFITLLIFGSITLVCWQITEEVWELLGDIGSGESPVYELIMRLTDSSTLIFGDKLDPELAERISEAFGNTVSTILTRVASSVTGWVSAVPNALLYLVVTVISLIYFSIDLERINLFVRGLLPDGIGAMLSGLRRNFFSVAGKFVFSYMKLMLITFSITLIGLLILGVNGAFVIALLIALLDILPIIGVGTVLIPWSIIGFAIGDHKLGIGLLVLFAVNSVVRELLEPKIVGKSLNIHPLLMLALIYVGYALFGLQGLLMIPVIAVLVGFFFKKDDTAEIDESTAEK